MAITLEIGTPVTTQIPHHGTVLQLHTRIIPSEVNIQIPISFLSLSAALLDAEKLLFLFALATDSALLLQPLDPCAEMLIANSIWVHFYHKLKFLWSPYCNCSKLVFTSNFDSNNLNRSVRQDRQNFQDRFNLTYGILVLFSSWRKSFSCSGGKTIPCAEVAAQSEWL